MIAKDESFLCWEFFLLFHKISTFGNDVIEKNTNRKYHMTPKLYMYFYTFTVTMICMTNK